MVANKPINLTYKNLIKPILFKKDAEDVHNHFTKLGKQLTKNNTTKSLLLKTFRYENPKLKQKILGIDFANPIGLSAGFDYDGHLAETMYYIGFGFNTVGTVTFQQYEGNKPPRLARLPKSKSLLVNKGFKSEGAEAVAKRLDKMNLHDKTVGLSVGSTNIPEIDTISKAIDDYINGFEVFKSKTYLKYFEINISCPNSRITESFADLKNYEDLLKEIKNLNIKQPLFVKMANELTLNHASKLIKIGIENGISGFIFSNLVKDRTNPYFDKTEIESVKNLKGNFSGKPTQKNADKLLRNMYKDYKNHTIFIGTGGVFNAQDAYEKIKNGASLVQLITGMVFEGPQLIGKINKDLVKMLKKNGFSNISEAIGCNFHK